MQSGVTDAAGAVAGPAALAAGIGQFRRYLADSFAAHAGFWELPPPEARRIMEVVRAPLARGGPAMARTHDATLTASGRPARVRIYLPAAAAPVPALVYLHGGGWMLFSIDTHDRIMREYAAGAGVAVVGVDYALAPEARFPTALRQVVEIVGWLQRSGAGFGIDPQRLALGGDSVGANLALAAAISLRDAGAAGAIRALLLNYGVYDNDFESASYRRYGGPDELLTRPEMMLFWRNYVAREQDRDDPLARLAAADVRGLPPAFLAIAEQDPLHDENVAMAAQLRAAGVAVTATVYPGTTHSFLEAVSMAEVARRALAEEATWLRATLLAD